jgi:hypothetical protein
MREDEAGRERTPWHWHPWFKQITNVAAHVSGAALLAAGVVDGLAARKHKGRNDHPGRRDQANTDGDGGNDRNRADKQGNDPKEDRGHQREPRQRSDGDGDGGNPNRGGKQERQVDESSEDPSAVAKKQKANQDSGSTAGGNDTTGGSEDTTSGGAADTTTGGNEDTTTSGDGNTTSGGGGRGDGGGNDAGNAGSGFFDSPLATKARRRANEFDNAGQDPDDGTFVDVNPDGESVYETDSVLV